MNRSARRITPLHRSRRFLAWALAAGVLAVAGGAVSPAVAAAAGSTSSCIDCHTDAAKLQEEAKGIPIPKGSALQAGKG